MHGSRRKGRNAAVWVAVALLVTVGCPLRDGNDGPFGGGEPMFDGFDFELGPGTQWTFQWDYLGTLWANTGSSRDEDWGEFTVTLGTSRQIEGITAYAVSVSGDSVDEGGFDFAPRWRYLALSGNRLLGSVDGATLQVIFDAQDGTWNGGGFFCEFSEEVEYSAAEGEVDNDYVSGPALQVGRSVGQPFCEFVVGYLICPYDESYDIWQYEYYRPEVGPVGYYCYVGVSYSGAGYFSAHTYTRNAGLVDVVNGGPVETEGSGDR